MVSFIESGFTTKSEYEAALKAGTLMTSSATAAGGVTIGTHSGAFQADEALGVWLLHQIEPYKNAPVTRSRDMKVLEPLTIVIDVAGTYDHALLRYDHHQRGFFGARRSRAAAPPHASKPDAPRAAYLLRARRDL